MITRFLRTQGAALSIAVPGLLIVGLAIRAWGGVVAPLDFWLDEASWATRLHERALTELSIRPVGYMALTRALAALGPPEAMLRLPSLIAGFGTLVFVYLSARSVFNSQAVVLVALVIAVFHPQLIVFSKEVKPYSLKVFI